VHRFDSNINDGREAHEVDGGMVVGVCVLTIAEHNLEHREAMNDWSCDLVAMLALHPFKFAMCSK
jgi:hypothetical protein